MKTYNLFLDDIRNPSDAFNYTNNSVYFKREWNVVRSYDEFVKFILDYHKSNIFGGSIPELISFDHDLADEHYTPQEHCDEKYNDWANGQNFKEKTGYHCAKWLIEFCQYNKIKLPLFICHSMNPVGKENILSILNNYKKFENI